jgi:Na+/H+-dicarboxylate symporter
MKYSLRFGLATLWLLILTISVSTGVIMFVLVLPGVGAQLRQATTSAEAACAEISHQYERYIAGFDSPPERLAEGQRELMWLLEVIFSRINAMEGG